MMEKYFITVLDEDMTWGFSEICTICRVDHELVFEMVNEGVLTPEGSSPETWRFNAVAIKRIQVTCRLQHDLGVNLPGARPGPRSPRRTGRTAQPAPADHLTSCGSERHEDIAGTHQLVRRHDPGRVWNNFGEKLSIRIYWRKIKWLPLLFC